MFQYRIKRERGENIFENQNILSFINRDVINKSGSVRSMKVLFFVRIIFHLKRILIIHLQKLMIIKSKVNVKTV